MNYKTKVEDGILSVSIAGEIDHHTAIDLRHAIDRELEREGLTALRLELLETDFMDSSGLGLILGRLRKTREKGMRLILCSPSPAVRKILRLAGVEKELETEE